MYCLNGVTYSGGHTQEVNGIRTVAVNRDNGEWQRYKGTTWKVLDGPHAGRLFRVEDAGTRAHFDMWFGDHPDCQNMARQYGGRTIRVERVA